MGTYVIQIHVKIDAPMPGDALQSALEQYPEAESYKPLLNEDFEYPYYVTNREGNCSIIMAHNCADAKESALLRSSEGKRARLATTIDIDEFRASGGLLPEGL